MNIKVTITTTLENSVWGFSDFLGGRKITDPSAQSDLNTLMWEDIQAVLQDAIFEFEEDKDNK